MPVICTTTCELVLVSQYARILRSHETHRALYVCGAVAAWLASAVLKHSLHAAYSATSTQFTVCECLTRLIKMSVQAHAVGELV
jgi:hypothetical protein